MRRSQFAHGPLDPGDIGAALYLDEVRAAGGADTSYGTGFSYPITGGPISIGPAGG